jgi:2'-5' RNA ligase
VRAFISLSAGDLFAGAGSEPVEALEAALKGAGGELRFVKADARHLTLRFFAELPDARQAEVASAIAKVAGEQHPFPVTTLGVGFFPSAVRPRVVWVGMGDPEDRIRQLYAALEDKLEAGGLGRGEPHFVPHVTIARVTRAPPGPALAQAVDPFVHARFGSSTASGLEFTQSTLQKGGPVYRRIAHHKFAAKRP